MNRRAAVCFALMCATASMTLFVAACTGNSSGNNSPPAPKQAPPFWDDQLDHNWIYRNQYKTTMRTLWLDCAKIVTMSRGEGTPDYALVEAYAKDIASRADRLAMRWEAFAAPGKAVVEALADKDWLSANAENETFGKACDSCHLETWSPIYQHATKEIIGKWLRNEIPSAHDSMLNEGEPPPAVENRAVMQAMLVHHDKTEAAIIAKDASAAIAHVQAIMDIAAKRGKRWRDLQIAADALARLAANKEREKLGQSYGEMVSHCYQCHQVHAVFADPKTPPRAVLNPMPFD